MQKFLLMSVVGMTAFAMAMPLGAADHCNGTVLDIGGTAYVDDRGGLPWIYLESNSEEGLQSGGSSDVFGWSDPCAHANPDMLVF